VPRRIRLTRARTSSGAPLVLITRPPSSAGSWKRPARSSPPATQSPSAWNGVPTHPSSARPVCRPQPHPLVGQPHPPLRALL